MLLFIFESIGTSELILIGIVALIFLGPRKLPEIARKMGKIMADLRSTTAEFKETWEREVNFEEEARSLKDLVNDGESSEKVSIDSGVSTVSFPEIKQIDAAEFADRPTEQETDIENSPAQASAEEPEANLLSDKRNWL